MVLLKGFGADGFRFFTNYKSRKGEQLAGAPLAALILYWREVDRQVRIRGPVERLPETESDAYFATRPRASQLGAWASPQSRPLADRAELDARLKEVEERFGDGEVPRPPHWGGYVVRQDEVEFWQGQVGRLHDRFLYTRVDDGWRIERLGP
jgi:pyridoxamine 5'-phosphate oxidase